MQVPIEERERLLLKAGLDPAELANLTLVYQDPLTQVLPVTSVNPVLCMFGSTLSLGTAIQSRSVFNYPLLVYVACIFDDRRQSCRRGI